MTTLGRGLFVAEEDHGVDGEGSASGEPGCGESEEEHGEEDAEEDDGVFGGGLVDDGGEDFGGEEAEEETGGGAEGEEAEGAAEGGAEDFLLAGAEGDADAELAQAAGDDVRGHTKDAGDGEHGAEQAEDAEGHSGDAGSEEGGVKLAVPGLDIEGDGGIEGAEGALESSGHFLRIARGAHDEVDFGVALLEHGEEHGGGRGLGEGGVLAVLNDADDLDARAAPDFEVAADGLPDGTEDFAGEFLIDDGDAGGLFVVVPGEGAAGKERGAGGAEISRGYVVFVGVGGGVGDPVVVTASRKTGESPPPPIWRGGSLM
jgi:hypothetical protein